MGRVKSDPSINLLFPLEVARRLEDPWCRLQIIYLSITFRIHQSEAPFSISFGFTQPTASLPWFYQFL